VTRTGILKVGNHPTNSVKVLMKSQSENHSLVSVFY